MRIDTNRHENSCFMLHASSVILVVISSLLMNYASVALATDVSGIIERDTVWTAEGSPYLVGGNILVNEGVTLKIEPGVTVQFKTPPIEQVAYYLRVDGTLTARGTQAGPIVFTAQDPAYPWGSIVFTDSSENWNEIASVGCILEHCIIEYAGKGQEASLLSVSASPLISNNIIRHSEAAGIRTVGGSQRIVGNLVHHATAGIHLACDGATIENNYLVDNQQGIYLDSSKYKIEIKNNTIIHSTPSTAGGCLNINLFRNSSSDADAAATQAKAVSQAADEAKTEAEAAVAQLPSYTEAYFAAVRAAEEAADRAELAALSAEQAERTAKEIVRTLTAHMMISKNHFTNTAGNAISITEQEPEANYTLSLSANTIENQEGNLSLLLYNWKHENPEPFNMPGNWWGTRDRAVIDAKIYDAKNDFYLPRVVYQPIAIEKIPDAGSDLSYQPGTGDDDDDDDDVPDEGMIVINEDTRWKEAGSPYLISGNILVKEGVELEIEPGAVIRFKSPADGASGYYIRVDGVLTAQGSEENPILFTVEDIVDYWGGIEFTDASADWDETTSTGSVLKQCIIEYAGDTRKEGEVIAGGAAVIISSASPLIAENTIRYGKGGAIRADGGTQTILSNLIHDNVRGITLTADIARVEKNCLVNNRQGIHIGEITQEIEISRNTIIADGIESHGPCLYLNLHHHDEPSAIRVLRNHVVTRVGHGITIAAPDPAANDTLRFTYNNIETAGEKMAVRLDAWQREEATAVPLPANWWGTTDVGEIDQNIHDGTADPLLPEVVYRPIAVKFISDAGSDLSYPDGDDGDALNQFGVINRDTRWRIGKSPYLITGNILIKENAALEIEPGVVVRFKTPPVASVGYYIRVDGMLKARGTDESPIQFTAEDPARLWGCIAFTETSADWDETASTGSCLSHCIIEYAGNSQAGGEEAFGGAGVKCFSASPLLEKNTLRYISGEGIWASGGFQRIKGNLIHDTPRGMALSVEGALIENNHMTTIAQGIYLGPSLGEIQIRKNTIINEFSETDGACLNLNLHLHEVPSDIQVSENHLVSGIGSTVAISADDPNANDTLHFTRNNMENTGGNLVVYLHHWQREDSRPLEMPLNCWGTANSDELDRMIYDEKDDFHLPRVDYPPMAVKEIAGSGSDIIYPPLDEGDDDDDAGDDDDVGDDDDDDDDDDEGPPDDQPGVISKDTVWTRSSDGTPHLITGNILVKKNATLEIEPGAVIRFKTPPLESVGYYIQVEGTLISRGTEEYPIILTAEDPAHSWGCIAFMDKSMDWDETTSTGSVISHCLIEYAGNAQEDGLADFGGAAVKCFSASPLLSDNLIRYSAGDGIWASGGNQRIFGNRIHNTGRAIFIAPERALIKNNYLINNGQGIFLSSGNGGIEVRRNSILNVETGETGLVHASATTYGTCLRINLYPHEDPSEIRIHDNHLINDAGNAIAISAQAPNVNVQLSLICNNIENTGGNLAVYLHDWQVENPAALTMTDNWWGTTEENEIRGQLYDSENDFWLPEVVYQPMMPERVPDAWATLPYPPLPNAGPGGVVDGDVTVTLDGSVSYDPHDIMSYQWTQTGGRSVTLSDPAAVRPTFVSPSVGPDEPLLTFQLTLTDPLGFWSAAEVSVGVDESIGVQLERDKGQCFVETACGDRPDVGAIFMSVCGIVSVLLIIGGFVLLKFQVNLVKIPSAHGGGMGIRGQGRKHDCLCKRRDNGRFDIS